MYAQRSSYSGEALSPDGSPYFYDKNKLSSGRDESPDRINFPYGRDKLSRQPQMSRSPSPYRKRRNPGDNDFYNTPGVPVMSDYDIRIHSPEMKGRRTEDIQEKRKYPFTIPSPPPPPILSVSKKKKAKAKSDQELSKINKPSTNPLSMLLADRNVSISTLLEAAIGSTGEKRSSTGLDPSTKAEILSSCEEKIGQLYRHRVCGPGCFIPDPVSQQFSLNVNSSILVNHYPKLEFNSRTINNIWHCPGVVEPVPQINEIINKTGHEDDRKLSIPSRYSTRTKSKGTRGNKGSVKVSDYIGTDDNLNCNVLHPEKPVSIQFGSTDVSNTSAYKSSASLECGNEPPSGYINSTDQWQQYGNDAQYNTTVTSCALYPQPPLSEYDPNNWSNSGAYNTFGYSQPQFENQQLVQYQPIGPYSSFGNNANYLVGQNENSPFAADEFAQFPSDQWYPSNEPNSQFQETVQYPLKQRSNLGGKESKKCHSKNSSKFVSPNLHVISLTDNKSTHGTSSPSDEKINRNEGQQMLHVTSSDDNKNKFLQRSTKHQEIGELIEKSEEDLEMSKILLQNENIRRLQLNDSVMYNIIVDLENGEKMYSYDYVMLHRMLWRKDKNKCRIYISKSVEMSILSLFHESFHDLNNSKLIDLAKRYLTIIPRIHEKLKYISRLCPLCEKKENFQRLGGHSSKRRSRSPRNKDSIPHVSRKSRSRSPSKKRQLHHTSPPSTITLSKNICIPTNYSRPSDSKDVVDPYIDNKLFKPHQKYENISLKRRPGSRSRERRNKSRRRSKYRRGSSFDKYRTESSPTERSGSCNEGVRIAKNKSRSSESPEVEAIADYIKLPSKNIEIINLVEEIDETDEDQWISYDSVGPDSEEETNDKNICNKTKKILDSKKDKRQIMKSKKRNATKDDIRRIDIYKTEGPIENKGLSKKLESGKHAVKKSNNYKLMHSVPTSKASGQKGQENKSQIKTKDRGIDGQESVSSILEYEPKSKNIQKQDQKVEKGNVKMLKEETKQKEEEQNRKSVEVEKKEMCKENASQQENKSEKENVKKQKEDNEETTHNENPKSVLETSSNLIENSCSSLKQLNKPENERTMSEKKDKEGSTQIEEQNKNAVKTESNITEDCSSSLKQENKSEKENVKKVKEETKQKTQEETKQNENTVEVDRNQKKDNSNAPHQEKEPVKEDVQKQKEIKEETELKEAQNLRNVEENSPLKKEIFTQKEESEAEDTTKNSCVVPHKEESNILQSGTNEKKEELNENSVSNKEENKPQVKLDFKARVRNIQLESNELKYIIDCIEMKKKENVDSCYLMKGGMLCKKCLIGDKSEVRIVAINELINNLVFTVHTMSTNHASVQKTLMLFNKHFIPISDMDKIVEEVVKGCQICN
ncbi:uncharacterized protein isoform X2 [Rhodnius prolixus]